MICFFLLLYLHPLPGSPIHPSPSFILVHIVQFHSIVFISSNHSCLIVHRQMVPCFIFTLTNVIVNSSLVSYPRLSMSSSIGPPFPIHTYQCHLHSTLPSLFPSIYSYSSSSSAHFPGVLCIFHPAGVPSPAPACSVNYVQETSQAEEWWAVGVSSPSGKKLRLPVFGSPSRGRRKVKKILLLQHRSLVPTAVTVAVFLVFLFKD